MQTKTLQHVAWLAVSVLAALSLAPCPASADKPAGVSAQTLKLPSGPASLKGLGESFAVSPSSGTGAFSVPLTLPPAALVPDLTLEYAAGAGKSELGVSFRLPVVTIYRQTDKGAPKFDESDRFAVSGPSLNDELVLVDETRRLYRLKNEGAFALFERDVTGNRWLVRLPDGGSAVLGGTASARETSLGRAHRWYITEERDRFGHRVEYRYFKEAETSGRVYLAEVAYQLHVAEAYHNHVELAYEPRPDVMMDASSGEPIVTSQRVSAIVVRQGTRVLRTYHLGYQTDGLLSLLSSVELEGENGERMPVLALDYIMRSRASGSFVQMQKLPPLEGLESGNAQFEDLTGDGLPDLLVGASGGYAYYENLDGVSFSTTRSHVAGSPDRGLGDADVVLADIDGDGLRDVLHQSGEGFRYYPALPPRRGVFLGYGPMRNLTTQEGGFHFGSAHVKMSDLNGDGRTDLIAQQPGQDKQLVNEQGERLRTLAMPELPLDVELTDPRVEHLDFNGDGVLDFVKREIGYTQSRVRVWHGVGAGKYLAEQQMLGVPKADPSECFLLDVNRDSQTDLLRVSGTWAAYYLNDGRGGFLPKQGGYTGLPSLSSTLKLLFADLNGNGTTDIVWHTRAGKLYYLDLMAEPFAGLLSRVDNGMGLVTEIAYRSSTDYAVLAKGAGKPWQSALSHPVPVISEQRISDSLEAVGLESSAAVTTFDYVDGYYDGREREFRGFGTVFTTEWGDDLHETLITEQRFHLGRNFATGEDQEALKGRALFAAKRNEQGQLYGTSEALWEQRTLCRVQGDTQVPLPPCGSALSEGNKDSHITLALSTAELSASYEKTATPRFSAVETEHDAFGNATVVRRWGEVTLSGPYVPGAGFSLANTQVGDDEIIEETDYLYNLPEWILGFPYATRVKSGSGALLSSSRSFYEDSHADQTGRDPADAATLTHGLLSVVQSWLADEQRWVTKDRTAYDAQGLPVWEESRGVRRHFERDAALALYPTAEVIDAGTSEAPVTLRYSAEYDLAHGLITALTEPNGQRVRMEYDGLSRLERVFNPRGEMVLAHAYEYGNPISRVHTQKLVDASHDQYVRSIDFVDGAGNTRLKKVQAEQPYGFVASGFTRVSARGGVVRSYRPFASSTGEFELAPDSAEASRTAFDALDRVTSTWARTTAHIASEFGVGTPFTPTSEKRYAPFVEESFAERDLLEGVRTYPSVLRVDGHGRVRRVERTNITEEGPQALATTVGYDARGLITSFADASHERSYHYDGLGRLTRINDLNLGGDVSFAYDDGGRPVRREDALGQVEAWQYDRAGRLLARTLSGHAHLPDTSFRFHWDKPDPRFASLVGEPAQNTLGRIAYTEFPVGARHYTYDYEGRAIAEVAELWDPAKPGSTFTAQERDAFVRRVSYDGAGMPVSTSEGDRLDTPEQEGVAFSFAYNSRQALVSATGGFVGETRALFQGITYRDTGEAIGADLGNGLRSCAAYDARELLERALVDRRENVDCRAIGYSGGRGLLNLGYRHTYDNHLAALDDLSVEVPNVERAGTQYEYDRLGQLSRVEHESPVLGSETFRYDAQQNIRSRTVQAPLGATARTLQYHYGEGAHPAPQRLSRVVQGSETLTLSYDAVGQVEHYQGHTLDYDVDGRVVRTLAPDGSTVEHHYDGNGDRRVTLVREPDGSLHVERMVSEGFSLRDGEEIATVRGGLALAELRRSQGVRIDGYLLDQLSAYVAGGGAQAGLMKPLPEEYIDLNRDGSADFDASDLTVAREAFWSESRTGGARTLLRYHHSDHLGSSTHVSDVRGQVVSEQRFSAYGDTMLRGGLPLLFGFTGVRRGLSDAGLVHMGTRAYAPALGRFLSPDRFVGERPEQMVDNLLDANLYAYARNNPALLIDPGGNKPWWKRALGVAQAIGGGLEIAAAGALTYGTGGLGAGFAAVIAAHGADNVYTGTMNAVTSEDHRTQTAQAVTVVAKAAGASDEAAVLWGDGVDMGLGFASAGGTASNMSRMGTATSHVDDLSHIGSSPAGKVRKTPFNAAPAGVQNCVNSVVSFLKAVKGKGRRIIPAGSHIAENGGRIKNALEQIIEHTGALFGAAQWKALDTARKTQFFVVFRGSNPLKSDHVLVGIVQNGKKMIYDPQSGQTWHNIKEFGDFIAYPLIFAE